jgi:uncharacterized protein (DUF58 family)
MEKEEVWKKVRQIDLIARRISAELGEGDVKSAFRGQGMVFSDVRPYAFGDNWRHFDWNVTARTGEPHVKVYQHEKELEVILLVDISPSSSFATGDQSKREAFAELAATICWSALRQMDRCGWLLFDDQPRLFRPASRNRKQTWQVILDVLTGTSQAGATHLTAAISHFLSLGTRRSLCFVLSDFQTPNFSQALTMLARKHEVIGLWYQDSWDMAIPDLGVVYIRDPETGNLRLVDTTSAKSRKTMQDAMRQKGEQLDAAFAAAGATLISIRQNEPLYLPLLKHFKQKRMKR